jgi:AraC family transcriptional regulator
LSSVAVDRYRARFRKVLEHIDAHLDADLTISDLSGIAAFSKYHFHRQFSELLGMGVYKYVQLSRLKRACYRLAFRTADAVLDIALVSGYERPEAFARAFKKSIGQTPSGFRKRPQWDPWHATYEPLTKLRIAYMKTTHRAQDVRIVAFEETKVAALEHHGKPDHLNDSIRSFIEWRKQSGLTPRVSATFNVVYDGDLRMDLCASTRHDVPANPFGVVNKTIPGGRCAVLRHTGSDDTLGETVAFLYSEWLPQSGEELRDFPLYFERLRFFPDVPEHEAITDVYMPLR